MTRKILVGFAFVLIMVMVIYAGFSVGMMSGATVSKNKPLLELTKITKNTTLKKVKVEKVLLQTLPISVKGEGRVVSLKSIKVSSEVQGQVIGGINLKMGQVFKKGELLYQLDGKEYSLGLKAKKSNFVTMLAGVLADIKQDFPEQYSIWITFYSSVSPEGTLPEIPTPRSSKEKTFIAAKGISTEYYNIKSMEEKLRKYAYYAPFNGSVLASYTDKGAIVNPGSPVVDIIENGNLEIEIPLSTEAAKVIAIGSFVKLTDKSTNKKYTGRVQRKGSFVNATTQSIPVYVKITNGDGLYSGMYLTAVFAAGNAKEVMIFPKRALINGNFIYEVKDSLLLKKQINLVHQEDNKAYIKGIEANALVVIEPLTQAKDSMKIAPVLVNEK
jgi:membrane fusion protein (multidrug efflux system)